MKKDSRILITGHTGLVGSNLLKRLLEDGYSNILYRSSKRINLLNQNEVDVFMDIWLPEYIFHCAAVVGGIQANINNPYKFLYENLMIQNNIIGSAIRNRAKKVIFLSSACMYPKDYKQPLREEYILNAPLEPTNEGYALAKICGAKLCEYANKQFGSGFIVLAPSNLYGTGDDFDLDNSHVLSALIKKICDVKERGEKEVEIWGTGEPRREFLYVDDLVDCMIWSMNNLEKTDTFLNVGTGEDVTIGELAVTIAEEVGYKGRFIYDTSKPDGMMRKCSDVSKINELGWQSKISLKEGIKKTIEYYRSIR